MKKKNRLRNIICLVVLIAIPLCLLIVRLYENHKKEDLMVFASDAVEKYISNKYNFEVNSIELSNDKYRTSKLEEGESVIVFKVTYNDSYFYALFVQFFRIFCFLRFYCFHTISFKKTQKVFNF